MCMYVDNSVGQYNRSMEQAITKLYINLVQNIFALLCSQCVLLGERERGREREKVYSANKNTLLNET